MRYWFTPTRKYRGGRVGARVMVASGENVARLLGAAGFTLLARWRPIPAVLAAMAEGVVDGAFARHDARTLSDEHLLRVAKTIGEPRSGGYARTTARDVAVFLDERRPGTPLPPPVTD